MNRWLSVEPFERGVTLVRALPLASRSFVPGAELATDLRDARVRVTRDASTRVVILVLGAEDAQTSEPSRDADMLAGIGTQAAGREAASRLAEELDAWAGLEKPTVAAIDGPLDGLGVSLALGAHGRVVSRGSRLSSSSLRHGLVPMPGTTARLVGLVGLEQATRVLLHQRELDADALGRAGWARAEPGDSVARAIELAQHEALAGPRAYALRPAQWLDAGRLWSGLDRGRDGIRAPRPELARPVELTRALLARAVASAAGGRGALRAFEIGAWGELFMSSIARRLARHRGLAPLPTCPAAAEAADRMRLAASLEAMALGASAGDDVVDRAARAWGFAFSPAAAAEATGREVLLRRAAMLAVAHGARFAWPRHGLAGRRARRPVLEELQQRVALAFVNEAFHALDEGLDAAGLDAAAIAHGGFPAFRGGPIAHARAVGLEQIELRLEHFARELGPRFEPAPSLARLRRDG